MTNYKLNHISLSISIAYILILPLVSVVFNTSGHIPLDVAVNLHYLTLQILNIGLVLYFYRKVVKHELVHIPIKVFHWFTTIGVITFVSCIGFFVSYSHHKSDAGIFLTLCTFFELLYFGIYLCCVTFKFNNDEIKEVYEKI